jgi:hypothetical protein
MQSAGPKTLMSAGTENRVRTSGAPQGRRLGRPRVCPTAAGRARLRIGVSRRLGLLAARSVGFSAAHAGAPICQQAHSCRDSGGGVTADWRTSEDRGHVLEQLGGAAALGGYGLSGMPSRCPG